MEFKLPSKPTIKLVNDESEQDTLPPPARPIRGGGDANFPQRIVPGSVTHPLTLNSQSFRQEQ